MFRRVIHAFLCGMALVQLGAVPPCLLDEAVGAVVAKVAPQPKADQCRPHIAYDEDASDPQFAAVRVSVPDPQSNLRHASFQPVPVLFYERSASSVLPSITGHAALHAVYCAGCPPDSRAAANLPLLI